MTRQAPLAALFATGLVAGACVSQAPEGALFAPASEPRATLGLRVDLPRGQRCAEAFDLELYKEAGVELIAWDDGSRCEGRTIEIRYLPRRTTPERVREAAARAGAKVAPADGNPRGDPR